MGPTLEQIQQKVNELQTALDAEQQQVKDLMAKKDSTIQTLNANIIALEESVAEGGTAEQRQAVIDSLTALKTDLEGTVSTEEENSEENNENASSGPEVGPGAEQQQ